MLCLDVMQVYECVIPNVSLTKIKLSAQVVNILTCFHLPGKSIKYSIYRDARCEFERKLKTRGVPLTEENALKFIFVEKDAALSLS